MHRLLSNLLDKRKIKREDLTLEEKTDFERWEKILSEGDMSLEKVAAFCASQVEKIEKQWADFGNEANKNDRLIVAHTIYKTIIKAIGAPEVERIALEEYLNKLIQS